jgi:hypothetical protein
MDQNLRAALAGELALELQSILERLDAQDLYLSAAKVSSALDALAEEAGLPDAGTGVEAPVIGEHRLTRSS